MNPSKIIQRALILCILLTGLHDLVQGQLPQDHQYQVELRTYMASLAESDFDIEITGLDYQQANYLADEELFSTWILRENRGRSHPGFSGLTRKARYYTLEEIERNGSVYMDISRGGFHDPIGTAWWANWDFAGNLYYGIIIALPILMLLNSLLFPILQRSG